MACMLVLLGLAGGLAAADVPDEFRVKREPVFEFAAGPKVTRSGRGATIEFTTKGLCDVVVAIEDDSPSAGSGQAPRIIRHLAAGVLGENAPPPLAKNSKKQSLAWDGKDDLGHYVEAPAACTVRVSLGLEPRFERTLFWSPKKRIAPGNRPLFAAAPEGVYVFEGGGVDHVRLFDHDGNYLRTVYPFPPDRSKPGANEGPKALQAALAGVRGLKWMQFPQDGRWLPVWNGLVQATLFTSGNNTGDNTLAKYGQAASAIALHGDRLALAMRSLNRMATDGTTGGMELEGPKTWFPGRGRQNEAAEAYPRSAAFSPDGKRLYLTGYRGGGKYAWMHGVVRMDYLGEKPPALFVGSMDPRGDGTDNTHFRCPMSVAFDSAGRLYVADYMNDRVQVYTEDGAFVKTIAPVDKPVNLFIHPKTGHLYVVSWMLVNRFVPNDKTNIPATLTHYGPLDEPRRIARYPLQFVGYNPTVSWNRTGGLQHDTFVDCYADSPTAWVVLGKGDTDSKLLQLRRSYSPSQYRSLPWLGAHYQLLVEKQGKLIEKANFGRDVAQAVGRVSPPQAPALDRQRLYVNPADGQLYVAEGDSGVGKAFRELLRIDPATGATRRVRLPFSTEEIGFDLDGLIYLRTDTLVARFDMKSWREVPWDYGEEREKPGFDGDGRKLISVLPLPGSGRPGCFHLGGFGVSPGGSVLVSCYNIKKLAVRIPGAFSASFAGGRPYTPRLYPGRLRWGEVHLWDRHGQLVDEDAVQGLPMTDGLALDANGNIYVMAAANRVLDGREYPLERAETLMKFAPGRGRIISTSKRAHLPIVAEDGPDRPFDLARGMAGHAWVQNARWLYGGVGFGGFNSSRGGGGCACWNARFDVDGFGRSFVTELNRFRVAVLDTSGNLILRIGKYGNVDDGRPMQLEGGPPDPRPVGGDEVALCHASYVATHSDRRLFIADYGNYRILSVKLGYHTERRIPLADLPAGG